MFPRKIFSSFQRNVWCPLKITRSHENQKLAIKVAISYIMPALTLTGKHLESIWSAKYCSANGFLGETEKVTEKRSVNAGCNIRIINQCCIAVEEQTKNEAMALPLAVGNSRNRDRSNFCG